MNKTVIVDRLNNIHSIFENNFSETEYSKVCPIFVKKYFDYKDTDYIYNKFIPNLHYNTRGLYFVPLRIDYSKILYLFPKDNKQKTHKNEGMKGKKEEKGGKEKDKKEKEGKKNETKEKKIIFRIMKTMKPDVYELYLMDGDNLSKKGFALVQTTKISHLLLSLFEDKDPMDEVKVECELNKNFNKWVPIKLSNGKISSVTDI